MILEAFEALRMTTGVVVGNCTIKRPSVWFPPFQLNPACEVLLHESNIVPTDDYESN